ncbi:MAG: HNH endonuclease [Spirochaetaceae bacterium]|nr:HNH endonuclease [Spirochaetaceae bacterium]
MAMSDNFIGDMICPLYGEEGIKQRVYISIYTLKKQNKFCLNLEHEEVKLFYRECLLIFSTVDYQKQAYFFIDLHKMNDNLRMQIKNLVEKYEFIDIKLRKIPSFFNNISNEEYFYIFLDSNISLGPKIYISESLRLLNNGISIDRLNEAIKEPFESRSKLFSNLRENYDIHYYNPNKKYVYGKSNKDARKCKYCHRTKDEGATFISEAHAIPESVGNKTIISAEECDKCNAWFSTTLDNVFFESIKYFRTLYEKKGKKGIPKLKFANGTEMLHSGKTLIVMRDSKNDKLSKDGSVIIPFEFTINFMNVYRALTKFVLTVLPTDELHYFQDTIKWIMNIENNGNKRDLPLVAINYNTQDYLDQPTLTVYKRKNDNYSLPYIYAELRIATIAFVYIIPYTTNDTRTFAKKEDFDNFLKFNIHYENFKDWIFGNYSIDESIPFTINTTIKNKRSDSI